MMASKVKTVLLLAFVIALGAGAAAGVVLSRAPAIAKNPTDTGEHSPLSDELKLSVAQREQMKMIWEGARDRAKEFFQKAEELQKGREAELVGLLTDEQKEKFEKISKKYADDFSVVTGKRDAMFQSAVEETKKILNAEQKAKYDEILSKRVGSPPPDGKFYPPPPPLGLKEPGGQ